MVPTRAANRLRPAARRDRIRDKEKLDRSKKQLGLGCALQEFEAPLATWCVDEQP